jgi:hypothetical protein
MISRRHLLRASSAVPAFLALSSEYALAADGWRQGDLLHLVPTASHERIAIKCSFRAPRTSVSITVDGRPHPGRRTDNAGRYFEFDVSGLEPDHRYELRLTDGTHSLTDPWPLTTFPHPQTKPDSVRLLAYTCAGGYPGLGDPGQEIFLPLPIRQRLLARALSFAPDAMIAIGDQIYWDQKTELEHRAPQRSAASRAFYESVGMLDYNLPATAARNEAAIKAACEPQIAHLYGVSLRSTPSYFVGDDHDYYENDEAWPNLVTLPPYAYQQSFARYTKALFLPEFLPDHERPALLSGSGAADRAPGISEAFGTFRYGNLVEALIYDCARFLSLKGNAAGLVPPEVERWLLARTIDQSVRHLLHVPSHPMGWSAGKWREWYPDVAMSEGKGPAIARMDAQGAAVKLTTDQPKFMWQQGWWQQHQRLLEALGSQPDRTGILLSGDLHATGHLRIDRSAALELPRGVHSILTGTLGTGTAWPSTARGTPPLIASNLAAASLADVEEKNGFTLVDLSQNEVTVRLFRWRRDEPEQRIDDLQPYHTFTTGRS